LDVDRRTDVEDVVTSSLLATLSVAAKVDRDHGQQAFLMQKEILMVESLPLLIGFGRVPRQRS
jgi:hypothetical protein